MTNTKFLVRVNRSGTRAPEYVQRIDRTPIQTTTNRKLALAMGRYTAEDAVKIGLINRSAAPEKLREDTMALAGKIAAKPYATVRTGKHAFYQQLEMPLEAAYAYAAQVMTENMLHAEANEGIGAFLEKREPKWPV